MEQTYFSNHELADFCFQISLILKAGISPEEGVAILIEDTKDKGIKKSLEAILVCINDGQPFYKGLEASQVFPDYLVNMAEIGELSGRLDEVMETLSAHYQNEHELSQSIKNAISYPLVMVAIMLLVVVVLMTKVLPVFNIVFASLGTGLTGISKAVLNLGTLFSKYSIVISIVLVILLVLYFYFTRNEKGKQKLKEFTAKFFLTKDITNKLSTSEFASGIAIALASGLDIDQSIDMASQLVTNPILKNKIEKCQKMVQEGESLADSLVSCDVFSGMAARLVNVGSKTGKMSEVMGSISKQYKEQANTQLYDIIGAIEPTIVAVLSVIVGVILLSVMLPLIGIMSNIG